MNVFFTDLDNTLIYSHRKEIRAEKVAVEQLNGKEQSYMTAYTFSFLRRADWIATVPVTTRSEAQYRRLRLREAADIRYAVVCNGGKLLLDGTEDPDWSDETMGLVREDLPELARLGEKICELCGNELHTPEPYYYYMKAEDPEGLCSELIKAGGSGRIRIAHDHRKVYLFPCGVDKGQAVRRFRERFGTGVTAGAGDSTMDIPMLDETDYAMAPEPLCGNIRGAHVTRLSGEIISDQICRELERMHREGIL